MDKSILTDDMEHCYYCGKKAITVRNLYSSDYVNSELHCQQDGLFIPLCWDCNVKLNTNPQKLRSLRMAGQSAFENEYSDKIFEKRYGKHFL